MSDQTLTQKLEALEGGTDFSDPNLYADLLGYNEAEQPAAAPAPQGDTAAPAPAPEAAPAAAESNPAPAVAEPKEGAIAGVLTKDGKHVMPFSVVQNLRQTTHDQAARIAELQTALEQANAEKQAQADGTSTEHSQAQADAALLQFTEEELADLEAIPSAAKLVKSVQALQARITEVQAAPAAAPAAPAVAPNTDDIQSAIDALPLLATWQAKGGELWTKAVRLDSDLQSDPQWAGKPMAERFDEVQRRIASDYGFSVASTSRGNSAPATQPRSNPQPEAREVMPSLSDFSGGPTGIADPMAGASVGQMVDKATSSMSVEDIRKWVGLSY